MDLREVGLGEGGTDWIDLPPERDGWQTVVNAVMNL
jgi:hypothetical protein